MRQQTSAHTDRRFKIDPASSKGLLRGLDLPYLIYTQRPFDLQQHLRDVRCTYNRVPNAPPTVIDRRTQMTHWLDSAGSAYRLQDQHGTTGHNRVDTGWTLSIASESNIGHSEMVAAQLAAYYVAAGRKVVWVNATAAIQQQRDLRFLTKGWELGMLDALFVTGIRWEGSPLRFDKAFDWIRQTHPHTDRIIVGSGADPLAITRGMDLPAHRVLSVLENKVVRM